MNTLKYEFILLGWEILEHKFRYYEGEKYGLTSIPDHEYDRLEKRYEFLAKELGKEPYSSRMVGFDYSRPSCLLVLEKLTKKRKK